MEKDGTVFSGTIMTFPELFHAGEMMENDPEGTLKKEQGSYETLLDMRMNNEIPREVFIRKQQEVEKKIAELEQQMMRYGDVKPATEADVSEETGRKGCGAAFPSCPALCGYNSVFISFASVGRHFPKNIALQSEKPSR